jgi:hypothetical protein
MTHSYAAQTSRLQSNSFFALFFGKHAGLKHLPDHFINQKVTFLVRSKR